MTQSLKFQPYATKCERNGKCDSECMCILAWLLCTQMANIPDLRYRNAITHELFAHKINLVNSKLGYSIHEPPDFQSLSAARVTHKLYQCTIQQPTKKSKFVRWVSWKDSMPNFRPTNQIKSLLYNNYYNKRRLFNVCINLNLGRWDIWTWLTEDFIKVHEQHSETSPKLMMKETYEYCS